MKLKITIIVYFLCLTCFGQRMSIDTLQSAVFYYTAEDGSLTIDFEHSMNAKIKVDWNKYPKLVSVEISKYSIDNKSTLEGLKKIKIKKLSFASSNFESFKSYNKLPKDIIRFEIWRKPLTKTDTLFLPKELEQWPNLKFSSFGSGGFISMDRVDLTKLTKLDTLILQGQIYEVRSLSKLKTLPYLGLSYDDLDSNKAQRALTLINSLDNLLPNTKKEIWCFPPYQQITLFNGKTKPIKNVVKSDTLLSYDFASKSFVPNIVIDVIEHDECYYQMCHIKSLNNFTASKVPYLENSKGVVATINHPIISITGRKIALGNISPNEFVFYEENNLLNKIQLGTKQLFYEKTKLYNLVTKEKNYFVNGYLFADK